MLWMNLFQGVPAGSHRLPRHRYRVRMSPLCCAVYRFPPGSQVCSHLVLVIQIPAIVYPRRSYLSCCREKTYIGGFRCTPSRRATSFHISGITVENLSIKAERTREWLHRGKNGLRVSRLRLSRITHTEVRAIRVMKHQRANASFQIHHLR
jgi:hypothetical protein